MESFRKSRSVKRRASSGTPQKRIVEALENVRDIKTIWKQLEGLANSIYGMERHN